VTEKIADPGKAAAVRAAGGVRALARLLGISAAAVCKWRQIPAGRIAQVETATKIDRCELRADLYVRRY
jgi:DNA-binding transcriptional regulator YdaS (Cro superfamily)